MEMFPGEENREQDWIGMKEREGCLTYVIYPVREGRRGRFVDYPHDIQTGDSACVFRRLSLPIVEVRRNGDYGVYHSVAKVLIYHPYPKYLFKNSKGEIFK